jgi:hypothetical protein
MADQTTSVRLPGVTDELARDIAQRIEEFERDHQDDVLRDGPGWVPRIRRVDYVIAFAVNAVILVWLILALGTG